MTLSPTEQAKVAEGLQRVTEVAAKTSNRTSGHPKETLGMLADAVRQQFNNTLRADGFLRKPEFVYHYYNDMKNFLHFYAKKYSNLSRLYTAGRSFEGRQLWVLEVKRTLFLRFPLLINC